MDRPDYVAVVRLFFGLAAIVAGYAKPVWRWLQRNRATGWPITPGRIELVDVDEKKWFPSSASFRGRSAMHIVKLGYSYSIAGTGVLRDVQTRL